MHSWYGGTPRVRDGHRHSWYGRAPGELASLSISASIFFLMVSQSMLISCLYLTSLLSLYVHSGPLPLPKEDYKSFGQPSNLRNYSEVGMEMMIYIIHFEFLKKANLKICIIFIIP